MKARRSSTLACGHHVLVGQLIVKRGGSWQCLECALADVKTTASSPPAAAQKGTT